MLTKTGFVESLVSNVKESRTQNSIFEMIATVSKALCSMRVSAEFRRRTQLRFHNIKIFLKLAPFLSCERNVSGK